MRLTGIALLAACHEDPLGRPDPPEDLPSSTGSSPEWVFQDAWMYEGSGFVGYGAYDEDGGLSGAGLDAGFHQPGLPEHIEILEDRVDPVDGPEDCGLTEVLDLRYPPASGGGGALVDAGTVTLTLPDASRVDLDPPSTEPYGSPRYGLSFDDLGGPPYGEALRIEATGGPDAAAFDPIELPALPAALSFVDGPAAGDVLPREDLEVRWTGTSDGTVLVALAVGPFLHYDEYLDCLADDDGSFTIPGELLRELPGEDVILSIRRQVASTVSLPDGRALSVRAANRQSVFDLTLAPLE